MTAKLASSAALFLFATAPLAAQAPAYIVTRLGTDTVAIERYTRSSNKLEGDLVLRNPRVRTIHYIADLGSQGEIKSMTATVRRPNTDPTAAPATPPIIASHRPCLTTSQSTSRGCAPSAIRTLSSCRR